MIHLYTVVTPYMIAKFCRSLKDAADDVMSATAIEYRFQRKHYDRLVSRRESLGYKSPCLRERVSGSCPTTVWKTHDAAETMGIFWMRTILSLVPPNWKRWGLYLPSLDITRDPYAERRFCTMCAAKRSMLRPAAMN